MRLLKDHETELTSIMPARTQHVDGTPHLATTYAVGRGKDPKLAAEHARHLLPWARQRVIGSVPDIETQLRDERKAAARAKRETMREAA